MKHILFISILLVSTGLYAQAPKGKAKLGTLYGEKFDERGAMEAQDLLRMVPERDTLPVKIRTIVFNSCASEGCWLTFKINDSTEAIAKTRAHAFFVPLDIRGKTVVINGKSYYKTTTVKELKHLAEDAKKSKKEIDAITKDKKQLVVIASGILVVHP